MSGLESCVIKIGNIEFEAKDIRDFCKALLTMRNHRGESQADNLLLYRRAGKLLEQAIAAGVPAAEAAQMVKSQLERSGVDGQAATKAITLYTRRKRQGVSDTDMSDDVLGEDGNITEQRPESILDESRLRNYKYYAKRSNEEIINVEMVVPKEMIQDMLPPGKVGGDMDMAVMSVYVNNPDGTPVMVDVVNEDGETVQERKTGIRVYSYNPHNWNRRDSTSDASEIREKVVVEATTQIYRKMQRRQANKVVQKKALIDKIYSQGAEAHDADYGGSTIEQNKITKDLTVGLDSKGNPIVVTKGQNLAHIKARMKKRKRPDQDQQRV